MNTPFQPFSNLVLKGFGNFTAHGKALPESSCKRQYGIPKGAKESGWQLFLMKANQIVRVWLFFDDVHLMISKCGGRVGRCVWSD